tara:strand:- start:142 stop:600 length:459 start_codon:yes stop_codon:yes gene_type:complete
MKKITFKSNCKNEYPDNYFSYDYQKTIVSNLYFGLNFEHKNNIEKQISKKLSSYLNQDKKQKRPIDNIITKDETIEKLLESNLKCYYCKLNVLLLYKMIKDKLQWTLERINNSLSHTKDNVVVCCLGCNIKRGKKNSDDFLYAKQLQIIKSI